MIPFDLYPGGGRSLIGRCGDDNCRHGYGLRLQRMTGQTSCAYCGHSLVDRYQHWLLLSVDHVIPVSTGLAIGLPAVWVHDFCNTVLACTGCNGFKNRFELPADTPPPADFEGFLLLRDATFSTRRQLVAESRELEMAFYNSRPWEARLSAEGVRS